MFFIYLYVYTQYLYLQRVFFTKQPVCRNFLERAIATAALTLDKISAVDHFSYGGFHKWGYPQMVGLQWKIQLKLII